MPEAAKKTWAKVAFGDVVRLSKERAKDPEADGLEQYVGLEHLEPGDLKIRSWGDIADGTTFTNVFKPGQVLFGKRRAYQRKVAVADFSGVCSGDIYVLEPKGDDLLPELLPFICQTDAFFDHAVGTSAGSLSPRTNWKSLATFEFALPPLEEQRRIAEVLVAADAAKETTQIAQHRIGAIRLALAETYLNDNAADTPLDSILESTAYGTSERATTEEAGLPVLRIPNVLRGSIVLDDLKWIEMDAKDEERYRIMDGDILLVRTNGNPDYVGRCVVARSLPRLFVYASYLIRLRVNLNRVIPEFVATLLNAPSTRRTLRGVIRSSAGNYNINTKGIRGQAIPLPSLAAQSAFLDKFSAVRSASDQIEERIEGIQRLQRTLLMEVGL